jgi:Ni2+-binding GTPase involved in maturation of urease and hydrogenase
MATDNYLRENERYSAAAQIILGGWVEALQIALDVANTTKSIDIIERFAEQRISLGNVISMLEDYSDDVAIKQNLQRLKQLKPMFDALIIEPGNNFDPASPSGQKSIEMYLIKVNEVGRKIKEIRKEIVS